MTDTEIDAQEGTLALAPVSRFDLLVSDLCAEIDMLERRLAKSEAERDKWRTKCRELSESSINSSHALTGSMLNLFSRCTITPKADL